MATGKKNQCNNNGCKYAESIGALKNSILNIDSKLNIINDKLDLIHILDKRVSSVELKLRWSYGAFVLIFD